MNSTQVAVFTLAAYFDTKSHKYFLFTITGILYALILCANVLLMVVICCHPSLHEPMYMFLLSLFGNELLGSSSLFPLLLVQILSEVHTIPAPMCFLQIFCLHSYGCIEFAILAVMSYDRYAAICFPLRYNTLMTAKKVSLLVAAACFTSFVILGITASLTFSLQFCRSVIDKVYCDNYTVVKLACSDTRVNNVYGLTISAAFVLTAVVFILHSYMRILNVCFRSSRETRQKAVSTCTPHLASLLNYTCGSIFETLQSRFDMSRVPNMLRVFLSLYFLTCPPLFNPVLYGLKLSKIRLRCRSLILALCGKKH